MSISLSPETERLIQEHLRATGMASADELVRLVLDSFEQSRGEDFESLDEQTLAAIAEAEAEFERGKGRPWDEVREELRTRFVK